MYNLRLICTFSIFMSWFYVTHGQGDSPTTKKIFTLTPQNQELNQLNDYLEIMEDSSNSMTIEQVTSKKNIERFVSYHEIKSLNAESAYWGKISIKNDFQIDKEWILFLGVANFAQAYFPVQGGNWLMQETGRLVPASRKTINLGRDCVIPLTFSQLDAPITFYIRLKSIDHRTPFFQVLLQTRRMWDAGFLKRNLFQGLFQGILWILIFYHLATYFMVRKNLYLYYSAYILVAATYYLAVSGFLTETIWKEYPIANEYTWIIANYSIVPFYFQFLRSFFQLKEVMPKWDKILYGWLVFKIFVLLVFLAVVITTFNIGTPNLIATTINIIDPFISLSFVISLIYTSIRRQRKLGSALYVIIGASILNLFMIYNYSDVVLHYSAKNDTSMIQIGICFEILFFAIGLSHKEKEKQRERENYQSQLIEQLTENEHIKNRANQILERKVAERTSEIVKKNTLLEQQKEEIIASNDMLNEQKSVLVAKNQELKYQQQQILSQRDNIEISNQKLKRFNQKLTDSIRYARTIQQAVLPTEQQIHELLNDYFIIFRPKDIVSGDFYWMLKVKTHTFIAVADCTGHGVPGAFMSLISNTLLSETVRVNQIYEPAEILEALHQKVVIALRQKEKANRDGMDVVICRIDELDKQHVSLSFSGAKRPIFHTISHHHDIQEIKGDSKPIGGVRRKVKPPFTQKSIQLQKGQIIYLMTDGLVDQHGPNVSKFGTLNLKYTLSKYKDLSLSRQKEIYIDILDAHQQDSEQRDDITVLGVRL